MKVMIEVQKLALRTRPTPQSFIEENIVATPKLFAEMKELRPMSMVLPKEGNAIFCVFPDFKDDETKSQSMLQTRSFVKSVDCIAYVFMSESWVTVAKSKEELRLAKDLDYKISMLPDRKEAVVLTMEYKVDGKVSRKMAVWDILRNPNRLENRIDMDGGEGRMVGMLSDDR